MKINTIINSDSKIEILDNGNTSIYQEIATLIDKPHYLDLLQQIRNESHCYGGGDPCEDDIRDLFVGTTGGEGYDINISKYSKLKRFEMLLPNEYDNVLTFCKSSDSALQTQTEAVLMCFEFGQPFYFIPIIIQTFFYDAVNSDFLKRTQAVVNDYDYRERRFDEVMLPKVSIEISQRSTITEIKSALRESKKIFTTDPRFKFFDKKPDYFNNIRAYRQWYWDYLDCKSYSEVSSKWMKNPDVDVNDSGSDESVVLKGIRTYQQLLEL